MRKWILLGLLIIALFLRLTQLSSYPVGFNPDEASFGYDAYSILKTGKDQWGYSFPLVFKSFGDFKPPLYTYLAVPFVWLFGLTKTAVRLPNALFGTAAVYVTYLMVKELFERGTTRQLARNYAEKIALVSALLLAISPWHIMMSRGAFEANLTTFFLPFGLYLFLKGFREPKKMIWSAVVFGLNLFTYHSAKFVTPLIVLAAVLLFRNELKKVEKEILLKAAAVLGLFVVLMGYTFLAGAGTRVRDVNIFKGSLEAASGQRLVAANFGLPDFIARLLHNKYQVSLERSVDSYLQYFSPQFLFTHGPGEATYGMIPGRGMLYWFELPFLLGFLIVISRRKYKKVSAFLLCWLLMAPIPAALAVGPGFAGNRSAIMMPGLQIALALGAMEVFVLTKNKLSMFKPRYLVTTYCLISFIFFLSFLEDYFIQSPFKTADKMLYGNLEAAQWLAGSQTDGKTVVVSRKLSEPQIYIAFANKWNPKDYQQQTIDWNYQDLGLGWVDQIPEYRLGNYIFRSIHLEEYDRDGNYYLVGKPEEFPIDVVVDKMIPFPNGKPAILIVNPASQISIKAN